MKQNITSLVVPIKTHSSIILFIDSHMEKRAHKTSQYESVLFETICDVAASVNEQRMHAMQKYKGHRDEGS